MSATSAPDKWMTMSIPISRGGFNCLLTFRPGFKAATFERERAQRLPPRLDQIEVCGILRLKDELPTRMLQTKQEDITRAMCAQVINNRIDTIEIRRQPFLDTLKKVYPVECRACAVGLRQRLSGYWSKGAEDIAFITPPVVDLLSGSLRRSPRFGLWLNPRQLMSRIALGGDRTHFVHTDHRAVFRRVGVERFNEPLFLANSGSTRSPNQVSCVRQRRPSAINNSSIRLRLISIFFSSLRYVSRRSSVQQAKGCPSFCGSLKAAAMTSATCSAL